MTAVRPVRKSRILKFFRKRPYLLEMAYSWTHKLFALLEPLIGRAGNERVERLLKGSEEWSKKQLFDCRMCGQCVLHSTGMVCPMGCPKNLRNGACGGVRANGHCEVFPEMRCVWVEAFETSQSMRTYGGEMMHINPPVNRQLTDRSAWITQMTGEDKEVPKAWVGLNTITVLPEEYPSK